MELTPVSDDGSVASLRAIPTETERIAPSRSEIERVLGPEGFSRFVILDLRDLTILTSGVAGWLLSVNRHFLETGGQLVVHSLSQSMKDSFRLMRLDQILTSAPDEAAARALAAW
jgi:anti-anti-sigma regulatory factor